MFIKQVVEDQWQGRCNRQRTYPQPTWRTVEAVIRGMDGRVSDLVMLEAEGGMHMAIGGGGAGCYVVHATLAGGDTHVVVDPAKVSDRDHIVQLVAGGQVSEFPARMCVGLSAVLTAARAFAEEARLDKSLQWEGWS